MVMMNIVDITRSIAEGRTSLGIELGSTRIKAVLIGEDHSPIASGDHAWENKFEDGIWTYSLEDVHNGLQSCYRSLNEDVKQKYGLSITKVGSIGVSAMMHGYLVFDKSDNLLVPFRTWRNTITEQAALELRKMFRFNIPQRWSIAHLYQAILNGEKHVGEITFLTTLAGYVHWKLTGRKVVGIGDASGIFPIDSNSSNYNTDMIEQFENLISDRGFSWNLSEILPKILMAGDNAGELTPEGAKLLDPSGNLQAGIPLCPPEGDAGTGMTATNSIAERTGNISAGTSIFSMVVLEKELSGVYTEIDMVTTPVGKPVAMVHCNTCTSDIDAWVRIMQQAIESVGLTVDKSRLYEALYNSALESDDDCGNLLSYNYLAGEPVTGLDEGRPLFVRMPDSRFTLANFMRSLLNSAICTLRIGMDILFEKEHVRLDKLLGHGGLFKTKLVGQKIMAAALNTPISVMETAGEGGAWGMALLAAYMLRKQDNEPLDNYLNNKVFTEGGGSTEFPDSVDVNNFNKYLERYVKGLEVERAAVEYMK
jgi:sugar (pentulose or hexulose) kinase